MVPYFHENENLLYNKWFWKNADEIDEETVFKDQIIHLLK